MDEYADEDSNVNTFCNCKSFGYTNVNTNVDRYAIFN